MKNITGKKIKRIRLEKGLTMQQFIEKIDGLKPGQGSNGTVNNWESGRNMPNARRLAKIAEMGGVSVGYLKSDAINDIPDDLDVVSKLVEKAKNGTLTKKEKEILDKTQKEIRVLDDIEYKQEMKNYSRQIRNFFKNDYKDLNLNEKDYVVFYLQLIKTFKAQKNPSALVYLGLITRLIYDAVYKKDDTDEDNMEYQIQSINEAVSNLIKTINYSKAIGKQFK